MFENKQLISVELQRLIGQAAMRWLGDYVAHGMKYNADAGLFQDGYHALDRDVQCVIAMYLDTTSLECMLRGWRRGVERILRI
jgi:hypothetical protein